VDLADRSLRKGAVDAVAKWLETRGGGDLPEKVRRDAARAARSGGMSLVVAKAGAQGNRALGAIHLKDVVKPGVKERFAELRRAGGRTVMIAGDNRLTAAAIAAKAGVDDFAEATPERKPELIRAEQAAGRMVAMCGAGSHDAPALAQADIGVAMNDGTPAAKEAADLIDLDSDPNKPRRVIGVGEQLLISCRALTTFRARVEAVLGADVPYEPDWCSIYTFQCRRMEKFRHGRVLFKGDSAHQMSPFGAREANSGLQDAD
jgi:K+-transporting ATPase ATPase B chain